MIFVTDIEKLPVVSNAYKIERKTVWNTVEPENLLVLVTGGECIFNINNTDFNVKNGEMIFIPAGQQYLRKPKNNKSACFYYFHFKTDTPISEVENSDVISILEKRKKELDTTIINSAKNRFEPLKTLYIKQHTLLDKTAVSLADKIIKEITSQRIESGFIISLHFSEILAHAMQSTVKDLLSDMSTKIDKPVPPKIKKAILYINQNYKQSITLKDLSDFCGITPQHIIRLFKNELGVTPTQYINRFKINYAKSLIRNNTALSVKEISYELGFENPSYFSRLFTKLEKENISDFKLRLNIPEELYKSGTATVSMKSPRNRKTQ